MVAVCIRPKTGTTSEAKKICDVKKYQVTFSKFAILSPDNMIEQPLGRNVRCKLSGIVV